MKKIDSSNFKIYVPVVLWADDLRELFSILSDYENVRITSDNIEYESLKEFLQHTSWRRASEVNIRVPEPYVSISMDNSSTRLHMSSSQRVELGLFSQLDEVLTRCERSPRFFYSYKWVLILPLFVQALFAVSPIAINADLKLAISILMLLWSSSVMYINLCKHSIVNRVNEKDRPGFLKRNLDGILIGIISAILGGIVGIFTPPIVEKLWDKNPTITQNQVKPLQGNLPK
ncbi:hypothetical protein A7981_11360 [Methylovorus sp. MM2]|uniref:hypothetical protein n=1 Tax=Methylovorus sp. MM2 TaxID=1848038 RepID=UPI0007E17942|nr:hypothetical protein [Methylovorus sp. MM2]OAM51316.1 hypothetical protein A7981_11360 [Methylovorus sp. MM2]